MLMLGQSYDCASARDVALEDMGKFHQHKQQNKAEKNMEKIGCPWDWL